MWLFRQLALLLGIGSSLVAAKPCSTQFPNVDISGMVKGPETMKDYKTNTPSTAPGGAKSYGKVNAICQEKAGVTPVKYDCCYDPNLYCKTITISGGVLNKKPITSTTPDGFCTKNPDCPTGYNCLNGVCCPNPSPKCPKGTTLEAGGQLKDSKPCTKDGDCSKERSKCVDITTEEEKKHFYDMKGKNMHCCVHPQTGPNPAVVTNAPATQKPKPGPTTPNGKCPFGIEKPETKKDCISHLRCTSKALCTTISKISNTKKQRCCEVKAEFMCPAGQFPYIIDEGVAKPAEGCEDGSEDHPSQNGVCCPKFFHKGDANISASKPLTVCQNHQDCGTEGFCGNLLPLKLSRAPVRTVRTLCFKKPEFERVKASTKDNDLIRCDQDCPNSAKNPCVCKTGKVNGEDTNEKYSFEKKCPYGADATKTTSCNDQSPCSATTICVNVFQTEKHCCPVSDDIQKACKGGEFPYLKGPEPCTVNSKDPTLCCPKFVNKQLGDDDVFEPIDYNQCSSAAPCTSTDHFCSESKALKFDNLVGSRDHCYEKPFYRSGGVKQPAVYSANGKELAKCTKGEDCQLEKGESKLAICEKVSLDGNKELKTKICYEGSCPLWGDGLIEMQDVKECTGYDQCKQIQVGGHKTHCYGVFGKTKHCCPMIKEKLCPGDELPLIDKETQKPKEGDCGDDLFEYDNGGLKLCCPKAISKDLNDAGVVVEPVDGSTDCEKNGGCSDDEFCGVSIKKKDKTGHATEIKHCYKSPIGQGGIPREDDGFGVTVCDKASDCKGLDHYCKVKGLMPSGYKKGICFNAKCPLSTGNKLPSDTLKECTSCTGNERCHPVGDGVSGCCVTDAFCPGGLIPVKVGDKTCANPNHFYRKISHENANIHACCHHAISKSMKATGTVWKLAETPEEMVTALDSQKKIGCDDTQFLDESIPMDGKEFEAKVEHCYPLPLSKGKLVKYGEGLKLCTKNMDCSGEREICDTTMSKIKKNTGIKDTTSACAEFACPLDNSFPYTFKTGTKTFCEKNKHCATDTQCHHTSTTSAFKVCCGVEDQYLCPGNVIPYMYKNLLNHQDSQGSLKCNEDGLTLVDDNKCCPIVISKDFYKGGQGDKVNPVDYKNTCDKHLDCGETGFCGQSVLESGKELKGKGGKEVFHCYPRPKCAGVTVLKGSEGGLKTCTKSSDCSGNEICDKDLAGINSGAYAKTGVCCDFQCQGFALESAPLSPWKSPKVCNCPSGETSTQAFCDKTIESDIDTIRICEKTTVPERYRLCEYKRDAVAIPTGSPKGTIEPLRKDGSLELIGCTDYINCRQQSYEMNQEKGEDKLAGLMSLLCLPAPRDLGNTSYASLCYKVDMCSDMYTIRQDQPTCPAVGNCKVDSYNGKCEKATVGPNADFHCCPNGSPRYSLFVVDVSESFRTEKDCSKLADCIGEKRFCDLKTRKCSYTSTATERSGTCTAEDMHCLDEREVCLAEDLATNGVEIKCYQHPLESCMKNKDCPVPKKMFCAPPAGTKEEDYAKTLRICHNNPIDTSREDKKEGLHLCQSDDNCKNASQEVCGVGGCTCVKVVPPTLAVKPTWGYCKKASPQKCRGIANETYNADGSVKGCTLNSECGATEFCDLKTLPAIEGGKKGICCSRPTDCDGEAVLEGTAGLKMCDSSGCGKNNGEFCKMEMNRDSTKSFAPTDLSETLWKEGDGFCCKFTCPALSHPEASGEILPAEGVCEAENCKSDNETIKSCHSQSPTSTYKRCCSYPRKKVCPLSAKGPYRVRTDAKQCNTTDSCPSGIDCINGWCCQQDFCGDGMTLKFDQPKCTNSTVEKDCKQPEGAGVACDDGKCCPSMRGGRVKEPFFTKVQCDKPEDCPKPKMYCHEKKKKCVHYGSRTDWNTDKKCEKGKSTCFGEKGHPGVCLYHSDDLNLAPQCWLDPMQKKDPNASKEDENDTEKEESSFGMGKTLAIIAIILVVGGVGSIGYAIYFLHGKQQLRLKLEAAKAAEARKEAAAEAKRQKEAAEKKAKKEAANEALKQLTAMEPTANGNPPALQVQFLTL